MDQPVNLNANERVSVVLEAQHWNTVLMCLSDAPFRVSAPLIEAIRSQCMAHERKEISTIGSAI